MSSSPDSASGGNRRRLALFSVVLVAAVSFAIIYVARAAHVEPIPAPQSATHALTLESVRARPHVLFLDAGGADRRLWAVPLEDPTQRVATDVVCARFHYQHGTGVALGGPNAPGGAWFLDAALRKTRAVTLRGVPSRARVSADGKHAAMTFFVTGDSYESGGFSTRSYIVEPNIPDARPIDLEDFALVHDGRTVDAPDVNYWGITFTRDPNTFYATVQTGGKRYLVRGDLAARQSVVVHDDIECPSLSPNGTTIAFKRRIPTQSGFEWRLALLDLATHAVRNLERDQRHVDDQVEWLDDAHLLYAVKREGSSKSTDTDVWSLATDDLTAPALFLHDASSPAVVHP